MMTLRRLVAAWACFLLLLGPAFAQDRPKPKRDKMPSDGKLLGFSRGILNVQTEDGKQWLVALGRNAQNISVVGQAEASWLQPGLLVRFTGRFNRKGEAIAPIKDLSVVTLREGMRFGATPQNTGGSFGGIGGGLFSDSEEEKKTNSKPTRAKKVKPEDISYTVIGKIIKIRKGELSIAAGRLLKIELDEKPRIDIDVADLSLAPQGASIKVDAWYVPNQPGRAMANKVTVALEQPLVGKTKTVRGAVKPAADDKDAADKDAADKDAADKDTAEKDAAESGDKKDGVENDQ